MGAARREEQIFGGGRHGFKGRSANCDQTRASSGRGHRVFDVQGENRARAAQKHSGGVHVVSGGRGLRHLDTYEKRTKGAGAFREVSGGVGVNFLVDTCVLSELAKRKPDANVVRWMKRNCATGQFFVSISKQ